MKFLVSAIILGMGVVPKSYDLAMGIMLLVTGLYVLAWMPTLKKRLAKRQQSGERTAEEVRRELKNMKLIIICFLAFGGFLLCTYAFYD